MTDLPDPGAKGFVFGEDAHRFDMFLVRAGPEIRGYVNACPHMGTPLAFLPDRFLTADKKRILCATHGAQFQILGGLCVFGPCKGRALAPINVTITNGAVLMA